jgi:peptidase E
MGGGGFSMEARNPRMDDHILALCGARRPRVCFVPTASGDAATYVARFERAFRRRRARTSVLSLFRRDAGDLAARVLAQDVVYVGGGSTFNLLALWRAHGLDRALAAAWRAGVVLAGVSAGALCWFEGGTTDSFGPFAPLHDGLGLLPGSFSPHYDAESGRRRVHHAAIRDGLPDGWACDDGAALHFVGRRLHAAVASRPGPKAWRIERDGPRVRERALPMTVLT